MTYVQWVIAVVSAVPRSVVVEWSVETARRAQFRELEQAFFASVRCVSPT